MTSLICRLFHYAGVNNAKTWIEHAPSNLCMTLKERFNDIWAEHILRLTQLADYSRALVSQVIHVMIDTLLLTTMPPGKEYSIYSNPQKC